MALAGGLVLLLALVVATYNALFEAKVAAPQRQSAISLAVWRGDPVAVSRLLREGAKVNAFVESPSAEFSPFGGTPLSLAVWRRDVRIARILLRHGADPNARLAKPWPLLLAVNRGDLKMARLLLHAGADPNRASCYRVTALRSAMERGDWPMVKLLRSAGAVPLYQSELEMQQALVRWKQPQPTSR